MRCRKTCDWYSMFVTLVLVPSFLGQTPVRSLWPCKSDRVWLKLHWHPFKQISTPLPGPEVYLKTTNDPISFINFNSPTYSNRFLPHYSFFLFLDPVLKPSMASISHSPFHSRFDSSLFSSLVISATYWDLWNVTITVSGRKGGSRDWLSRVSSLPVPRVLFLLPTFCRQSSDFFDLTSVDEPGLQIHPEGSERPLHLRVIITKSFFTHRCCRSSHRHLLFPLLYHQFSLSVFTLLS